MKSYDIKTKAYVMRRTNYGEADRILNIITPLGKMSVMAKGVRKLKSKLAGAVEMFCLSELNIHQGNSEIYTLTGAKMLKYYNQILTDYNKMELASEILKWANKYAEGTESEAFFEIVDESLGAINDGVSLSLVEGWVRINFLKNIGEEINLYRDNGGEKLSAEENYDWDSMERAFFKNPGGEFGADEIKLMRLMTTSKLKLVTRVKDADGKIEKILRLVRSLNH